jgi:hypothetical protein
MSTLDQNFQKASPQQFNGFEASLRFRHVLTYRLKHTTRQKDAKQKTCYFSTQTNLELKTRPFLLD